MALERQRLRDDLVSVIAAGRELSPEHDYALADVFLATAFREPESEGGKTRIFDDPRIIAAVAALCLSLAALIFALRPGHAHHDRAYYLNRPVYVGGHFFHDRDGWGPDQWWTPAGGPPYSTTP